jgi:hypothetical protein
VAKVLNKPRSVDCNWTSVSCSYHSNTLSHVASLAIIVLETIGQALYVNVRYINLKVQQAIRKRSRISGGYLYELLLRLETEIDLTTPIIHRARVLIIVHCVVLKILCRWPCIGPREMAQLPLR